MILFTITDETIPITNTTSQHVGTEATTENPICQKILESEDSKLSIGLFLVGIITARFGKYESIL